MMGKGIAWRWCRLVAVVTLATLAGCGEPLPSGQVLARVGRTDITTQQLEAMLAGAARLGRPTDAGTRAAALRALVEAAMLANGATSAGLDRRPDTARQVDAARTGIFANAFVRDGVSLTIGKEDLVAFYRAHPARYAQRRRYWARLVAVGGSDEDRAFARSVLSRPDERVDEAATIMRISRRSAQARQGVFTSDQVPPWLADRLAHLPSRRLYLSTPDEELLIEVDASKAIPRPFAEVKDALLALVIRERLEEARRRKLAALATTVLVTYGEQGTRILDAPARRP